MTTRKPGRSSRRSIRSHRGHFLAEVPGVIFMLLFFLVFPLMNMGSIALGYANLLQAAREGAHAAATAPAFSIVISGKQPAIVVAPQAVNGVAAASNFSQVTSTNVDILRTHQTTGNVTRYPNKLPAPADTSTYIYNLEVAVNGSVSPLLPYFGFETFNVSVSANEFAEAPSGLDD